MIQRGSLKERRRLHLLLLLLSSLSSSFVRLIKVNKLGSPVELVAPSFFISLLSSPPSVSVREISLDLSKGEGPSSYLLSAPLSSSSRHEETGGERRRKEETEGDRRREEEIGGDLNALLVVTGRGACEDKPLFEYGARRGHMTTQRKL